MEHNTGDNAAGDFFSRRSFLKGSAMLGLALGTGALGRSMRAAAESAAPGLNPARLIISPDETLNAIPLDYTGLSYETVQLTDPAYFSPDNHELIGLLRCLSPHGVLRLGGNSSEFCWWKDTPDAQAPVQKTAGQGRSDNWMPQTFHAITPQAVDHLAGFLRATGWTLIYGLNFGTGSPERDAVEAAYVANAVGRHLKYFQIGNEPDFYSQANNLLRPAGWGFSDYMNEWTAIAEAVLARVPNASFGGPDVGASSDWVTRFAQVAPERLKGRISTLSGHYYAVGPPDSPSASIPNLLAPSAEVVRRMHEIIPIAASVGLDFRMTEGNSCYRGGKAGMSNAFAATLWGGDYMLEMASLGCKGINFHSGGGSLIAQALGGKLPGARNAADVEAAKLGTFYSPIAGLPGASFSARPIFYGMKLAEQFAGMNLVRADFDTGAVNATGYAARGDAGFKVAIFNKDEADDLTVSIALNPGRGSLGKAKVWRLTGPALDATSGITLAGSTIGHSGAWRTAHAERVDARDGALTISVPHASAALLLVDHPS